MAWWYHPSLRDGATPLELADGWCKVYLSATIALSNKASSSCVGV